MDRWYKDRERQWSNNCSKRNVFRRPLKVKRQRRLAGCSINEARQHWRHARQLFWVAFCVQPASETTLTSVVFALRPRRPTVAPSPGIQMLSGCGSRTPERPAGGTLCVQERVASADRAEVVRCGRICCSPVLLPHEHVILMYELQES